MMKNEKIQKLELRSLFEGDIILERMTIADKKVNQNEQKTKKRLERFQAW